MRLPRLTSSLVIALVLSAGAAVRPAHAQGDETSTYNVLASDSYCPNGGTACSLSSGPEARYAEADAFGMPGQTSGPVAQVYAECDRYYTDTNGDRIQAYLFAGFPDTHSAMNVHGTGGVGPNPDESNTASTGYMAYVVKDAHSGDTGIVVGRQTANNDTDTKVSSGFTIILTGTLYRKDMTTNNDLPNTTGTLVCSTAGTPLSTEKQVAENEYEPIDFIN